jgi:glutamate-1-semialdehyde aminotransferase
MRSPWSRPIVVDTAAGSRFTDVDGNDYVEVAFGSTIASAGHRHPAVVEAVSSRLRRGIQSFRCQTPVPVKVAHGAVSPLRHVAGVTPWWWRNRPRTAGVGASGHLLNNWHEVGAKAP